MRMWMPMLAHRKSDILHPAFDILQPTSDVRPVSVRGTVVCGCGLVARRWA